MARYYRGLVTVTAQRLVDHLLVTSGQNASTSQVSFTLLTHANCQVARSCTTVLHFAIGCDPKTLFRSLVRLHLGHNKQPSLKKWILPSGSMKCPLLGTQKCTNQTSSRQGKIVQTRGSLEQITDAFLDRWWDDR